MLPDDAHCKWLLFAARPPLTHILAVILAPFPLIERGIVIMVFAPTLVAHLTLARFTLFAAHQRRALAAIAGVRSALRFDPAAASPADFRQGRLTGAQKAALT